MDFNLITDFISTIGFPIAACVAMYIMNDKQDKRHKEEIDALRETVELNTRAIDKLTDRLSS